MEEYSQQNNARQYYQPEPEQKQKSQIPTRLGILIIVAFSVFAFGGIYFYEYFFDQLPPVVQPAKRQVSALGQKLGGDRDSHGCIGSAGYSWCEAKQKCLRSWEEKCEAMQLLSEESIVSAVGQLEKVNFTKKDGIYIYENIQQKWRLDITDIVKGDINGDNFEDAVVHITTCGASCGSGFIVVIGKIRAGYEVFPVNPEGFVLSGAAQYAVKNILINKGLISISAENPTFDGATANILLKYRLSGRNLVKVN